MNAVGACVRACSERGAGFDVCGMSGMCICKSVCQQTDTNFAQFIALSKFCLPVACQRADLCAYFFFVRGCIRVGACWRDLERSGQVRKRKDGQGKL